jgi:probable rRNA maturation factor
MTVYVQIDNILLDLEGRPPVNDELLIQAASAVLAGHTFIQKTALTVVLTVDETIQELDREYLGVDSPTDVLSFPAGEMDPETQEFYLGDVIISYPRAQAQAAAAGHTPEAELQLLTVHGVLHLLGHDHAGSEEKNRMWTEQERILTALGCPARPPTIENEPPDGDLSVG